MPMEMNLEFMREDMREDAPGLQGPTYEVTHDTNPGHLAFFKALDAGEFYMYPCDM